MRLPPKEAAGRLWGEGVVPDNLHYTLQGREEDVGRAKPISLTCHRP